MENNVKHVIREETLFAGIREPIKHRDELIPRIQALHHHALDPERGPVLRLGL